MRSELMQHLRCRYASKVYIGSQLSFQDIHCFCLCQQPLGLCMRLRNLHYGSIVNADCLDSEAPGSVSE